MNGGYFTKYYLHTVTRVYNTPLFTLTSFMLCDFYPAIVIVPPPPHPHDKILYYHSAQCLGSHPLSAWAKPGTGPVDIMQIGVNPVHNLKAAASAAELQNRSNLI